MTDEAHVNDLLAQHKAALNSYREWDEKVKLLLKGRRASELTVEDMHAYREAASNRDAAYDQMRHLERSLLEGIPDADSGAYRRPDLGRGKRKT